MLLVKNHSHNVMFIYGVSYSVVLQFVIPILTSHRAYKVFMYARLVLHKSQVPLVAFLLPNNLFINHPFSGAIVLHIRSIPTYNYSR
jgi:hypothetical protein